MSLQVQADGKAYFYSLQWRKMTVSLLKVFFKISNSICCFKVKQPCCNYEMLLSSLAKIHFRLQCKSECFVHVNLHFNAIHIQSPSVST